MGVGAIPAHDQGLIREARVRLDSALDGILPAGPAEPLWLSKGALTDAQRCEGLFAARLGGEGPAFVHSERSAAGSLFHRCIEVDVGSRGRADVWEVATRAAERLARDDRAFAAHWHATDELDRSGLLADAARNVELFRASFPPLGPGGHAVPLPELRLRAPVAGGRVVLTGRVDLLLVLASEASGVEPNRLAIDLKSGAAHPEHAEDMRLYALLIGLRYGTPPVRVATVFLESGQWQSEDVTERTLGRAVDRVVEAAAAWARLSGVGAAPELRPGPHCGWCPRRAGCPAAEAAAVVAAT
jgi:hypothetical protein